jgi:ribonucleoside-diphosphate reductase alpha chain
MRASSTWRNSLRATEAGPHQKPPCLPITPDAPQCSECGSIMMRDGSCYKCGNCGVSSGCS